MEITHGTITQGVTHVAEQEHLNLLAAAPEMLAFCKALHERYNVDDRLGGLGDWLVDIIERADPGWHA